MLCFIEMESIYVRPRRAKPCKNAVIAAKTTSAGASKGKQAAMAASASEEDAVATSPGKTLAQIAEAASSISNSNKRKCEEMDNPAQSKRLDDTAPLQMKQNTEAATERVTPEEAPPVKTSVSTASEGENGGMTLAAAFNFPGLQTVAPSTSSSSPTVAVSTERGIVPSITSANALAPAPEKKFSATERREQPVLSKSQEFVSSSDEDIVVAGVATSSGNANTSSILVGAPSAMAAHKLQKVDAAAPPSMAAPPPPVASASLPHAAMVDVSSEKQAAATDNVNQDRRLSE